MKKRFRFLHVLIVFFLILVLFVGVQYLWKGDPGMLAEVPRQEIVAHRGVHANYHKGVYDRVTGCEAQHILPPSHDYIENTLRSIGAAFESGATIVEIDIRKTSDNNLVVFHDFALECRTDGRGLIADHIVDYLKTIDIGYGYTPDEGETYPYRGKGGGLMPTLDEVLTAFPDRTFLIDHKDGDIESSIILMKILSGYSLERRGRIYYWGPPETLDIIQEQYPEIRRFFVLRWQAKKYLLPFVLSFGIIKIPAEFEDLVLGIPAGYTKYIWGWPYRFIDKIHSSGMILYLMVDTAEEAEASRLIPVDGFVTDYIELVGSLLAR
jgi:glycerophosphoryl diester phosphodiesterase